MHSQELKKLQDLLIKLQQEHKIEKNLRHLAYQAVVTGSGDWEVFVARANRVESLDSLIRSTSALIEKMELTV